jgi:kynureninase
VPADAGDDVELVETDEGHFECLDPASEQLVGDRRAACRESRADAEALDRADPLAPFRERFVIQRSRTIYADGNSLGRLAERTVERIGQVVDEWGSRLVTALAGLDRAAATVGDLLAGVLGRARRGARLRLDDREPVQARCRGARAKPVRSSPTPTTSRPTATCSRASASSCLFARDPIEGRRGRRRPRRAPGATVALVCLSHVAYRVRALADVHGDRRRSRTTAGRSCSGT